MRLFIAINFDEPVKQKIQEMQSKLRKLDSGNFTKPENFHLTLAFLGEVAPGRVSDVKQVMDQLSFPPLTLIFDRIGHFHREDGDIWWIGLSENPELIQMQEELCHLLTAAGFKLETRHFSPHITLARKLSIKTELDGKSPQNEPFTAYTDTVSLMLSQRTNGRLTYTEQYAVKGKKKWN